MGAVFCPLSSMRATGKSPPSHRTIQSTPFVLADRVGVPSRVRDGSVRVANMSLPLTTGGPRTSAPLAALPRRGYCFKPKVGRASSESTLGAQYQMPTPKELLRSRTCGIHCFPAGLASYSLDRTNAWYGSLPTSAGSRGLAGSAVEAAAPFRAVAAAWTRGAFPFSGAPGAGSTSF